ESTDQGEGGAGGEHDGGGCGQQRNPHGQHPNGHERRGPAPTAGAHRGRRRPRTASRRPARSARRAIGVSSPGAGHDGGRVVFTGTPADLVAHGDTLTAIHLREYVAR
ncbi:hypothetical protein, partial [Micromonospora olivasterospora]|uniref:hypothetical protein n=1 Tax=Micromonospora olivasterospora TaxID=1880 RepID=UPI0031E2DB52